jgi:hypothetical protein
MPLRAKGRFVRGRISPSALKASTAIAVAVAGHLGVMLSPFFRLIAA